MSDLAAQIQRLLLPEMKCEPVSAPTPSVFIVPTTTGYSFPVPSGWSVTCTAPYTAGTFVLGGATFEYRVFRVDYGR